MKSFNSYYYLKEDHYNINLEIYLDQIQRNLINNVYTGNINFERYPSLTELPWWFKHIEITGLLDLRSNYKLKSFKNMPKKVEDFIGPQYDTEFNENKISSLEGLENMICKYRFMYNCIYLKDIRYLPLTAKETQLYNIRTLEGIKTNSLILQLTNLINIRDLFNLKDITSKIVTIKNAPSLISLEGLPSTVTHLIIDYARTIESFKGINSSIKRLQVSDCRNLKSLYDLKNLYFEKFEIICCDNIPLDQWQYCPVVDYLKYTSDEKISRELKLKLDLLRASGRIRELEIDGEIEENDDSEDPFNL